MNTLLFFVLIQACASLRFNELLDSGEVSEHEGRRRRRRRRRGGNTGTPAAFQVRNPSVQIDFQAINSVILGPSIVNTGSRTRPIVDRGWLIVFNDGAGTIGNIAANDMWSWGGPWNFRFVPNKFHSFRTEVAIWDTDGGAKSIWYVGFGNAYAAGQTALPTNMIGFGNGRNGGTDVNFYTSKTDAAGGTTLTHVVKATPANGGAALTLVNQPNLAAVSATAYPLPTKSESLGYSYLPAGQYGVAAKAAMTGIWRIYVGSVTTDDVDAAIAKNPELQMRLTVGQTCIAADKHHKLYVKHLTFRN